MADINLAKAYQDFADLLDEMDFSHVAYCIDVIAWNHRSGSPTVTFTLSTMVGPTGCTQVYDMPTLTAALSRMRELLSPLRTQPTTELGTVTVPDATDGGAG